VASPLFVSITCMCDDKRLVHTDVKSESLAGPVLNTKIILEIELLVSMREKFFGSPRSHH